MATTESSFNKNIISSNRNQADASNNNNLSLPVINIENEQKNSDDSLLMVPRNNALFSCKSPARLIIQSTPKILPPTDSYNNNLSKSQSSCGNSGIDNNNNNTNNNSNNKSFTRSNAKSASDSYSTLDNIEIQTMATTTITENENSETGELITMTTEIPLSVPCLEKFNNLNNSNGIIINGDFVLDTIEKDFLNMQENFVTTVNRKIDFQENLRQSFQRELHQKNNVIYREDDNNCNLPQKNTIGLNKSASAINIPLKKESKNNLTINSKNTKQNPLSPPTPDNKYLLQKNFSLPSIPSIQQQQEKEEELNDEPLEQTQTHRKRVKTPQLGDKVGVSLKKVTPPRSKIQVKNNLNPMLGVVLRKVEKKTQPIKSILDDDKPLYHFSIVRSKDNNSKQQNKNKSGTQASSANKTPLNNISPKNLHANYNPTTLMSTNTAGGKLTTSGNTSNQQQQQHIQSIKTNLVSSGKPAFPSARVLSPPKPKLVTIEKIEGDKIVIIKKLVVPKNCKIPPETLKKQIAALMAAEQSKVFIKLKRLSYF